MTRWRIRPDLDAPMPIKHATVIDHAPRLRWQRCRCQALARPHRTQDDEPKTRPLDLGLIRWIFGYTRPHAAKRNTLLVLALCRAIQLPLLAWMMGRVIDGPIAHRSAAGLVLGHAWGFWPWRPLRT